MVFEVCYGGGLPEARRHQVPTAAPMHLPSVLGVSDGGRDDRDREGYLGYRGELLRWCGDDGDDNDGGDDGDDNDGDDDDDDDDDS